MNNRLAGVVERRRRSGADARGPNATAAPANPFLASGSFSDWREALYLRDKRRGREDRAPGWRD